MAAKDQATSPAPYEEDDEDQVFSGTQPAAQRKWGKTDGGQATSTNATATGTQTAPRDEVVVEVGAEEREELGEGEEEEEMQGVEEEGGGRSVGVQVEQGAEGTIRAAERRGGKATWWRGIALGKGRGGDEWEGKKVAFKEARKERKKKWAALRKEMGEGLSHPKRANRRRRALEAKAARTRTDDGGREGTTTTPTNERGTSDHGRSLPSMDVGGSPGAPAFQSSPIPSASGVQPTLKRTKSFVLQRESGVGKTFLVRHGGRAAHSSTMPALLDLFHHVPKEREEKKEAADGGRGGEKRVVFHQDPTSPALREKQNQKAAESRAAIERQRQDAELDALCPPRALSPRVKDVRVTDAGGVGPWEAKEVERKKREKELWRRHAYDTPQATRGPRIHEARRRREEERKKNSPQQALDPWVREGRRMRDENARKEEDFRKKADKEEWDRQQKKFDEERKERRRKEEEKIDEEGREKRRREKDDERKKSMKGGSREIQQAANLCRIVDAHYDDRQVEDLRGRITKARHVAPLYPPTHEEDRREAAAKLARLEKLDREVEEEAKRVEKEKKEEKERIQKEMERQRDILIRVDDDEGRGNSTRSRRDSPWKASSEEGRPPGFSPGSTLTPTSAPLPSTRPSRQETLKRQERPRERKAGEPVRRRNPSEDRRRRR